MTQVSYNYTSVMLRFSDSRSAEPSVCGAARNCTVICCYLVTSKFTCNRIISTSRRAASLTFLFIIGLFKGMLHTIKNRPLQSTCDCDCEMSASQGLLASATCILMTSQLKPSQLRLRLRRKSALALRRSPPQAPISSSHHRSSTVHHHATRARWHCIFNVLPHSCPPPSTGVQLCHSYIFFILLFEYSLGALIRRPYSTVLQRQLPSGTCTPLSEKHVFG
jgi:hypothetical protein